MALELQQRDAGRWRMWFGLLGGAMAWLLHLISSYAIAEFGCVGSLGSIHWMDVSIVSWACIGSAIFCELVSLSAIWAAYASGPQKTIDMGSAAYEPRQYAALLGMGTSSLFALAILFESIPILYYLQRC